MTLKIYRPFSNTLPNICFYIVLVFILLALLITCGLYSESWNDVVGSSYRPPSLDNIFGTDIFGQSVFRKVLIGTEAAMKVGFVTSFVTLFIGATLGSIAGYFGGAIDDVVTYIVTVFSSIPYIMLLVSISYILGKSEFALYVALGLAMWPELCRLIRSEVLRHRQREYVIAAKSIGQRDFRILLEHVFPNIFHILIIQFSLIFQRAIKSEVILSYLGLVMRETPSWGGMINDAKDELGRGVWWQLLFASLFMFIIVLSLNIIGDALRDKFDPKLKGKG